MKERLLMFIKTIVHHMRTLEQSKLSAMCDAIERRASPKNVVFLNYTVSVEEVRTRLAHMNPVEIVGSTTIKDRSENIRRFNTDPSVKLIICNTKAGCCGIDLDDKIGNEARSVFISPSYDFNNMLQAIGRVYRCDSRSIPSIYFMYTKVSRTTKDGKVDSISESCLIKNIQTKMKFIVGVNDEFKFKCTPLLLDVPTPVPGIQRQGLALRVDGGKASLSVQI